MGEAETEASADETPHRRRHRVAWIVVGAIAIVLGAWWALHARKPARRTALVPAVTVRVAVAERGELPIHLDTIGTVTSLYTVALASQVNGLIREVRYAEGQSVHKGAPLVEIDPRPFEAALRQARGTLARDLQVLAQARMDLQRFREAWARNAIARQQLEDQEHVVRQAEGTVENDRGLVAAAEVQLAYCHIVAPIEGRVGLRLVDPGNVVTAASTTPLAVITQVQPISVVFTVSESDLGLLWSQPGHARGAEVAVFDRTRAHQLATGKLATIDNQIDPTTGTVRVRALFENRDEALFPNQFVNTRVLVRTLRDVITVPTSVIQRDGEKAFVYAIAGGHAHVVPVVVGASDESRSEVSGLAAGTQVASSGFEKLREGVPVVASGEEPGQPGPAAPAEQGAPAAPTAPAIPQARRR